ncbi:MAG: antitoxin VapB family protein [Candidatus Brockarchaeota archaeon]|nr:antitoxin VapB family protein [Candidatus Brockarchaeota archaeon]
MTKVISLSDEAYKRLKKAKRGKESFSDVILRLIKGEERVSLTTFAGRWKGEDIDEVFKEIGKGRKASVAREVKI